MTVERIKEREARLHKKLKDKGASFEPAELRTLKKRLRRAQRKRRALVQASQRRAGSKAAGESSAAAPSAAPAPEAAKAAKASGADEGKKGE